MTTTTDIPAVHYIDPDGLVGHLPGCPQRVPGGHYVEGPPPFAASCCIDLEEDTRLDPRFKTEDDPFPEFTPGAKPSTPRATEDEWEVDRVEEWLKELGRKTEARDMTPGLVKAIERWLRDYEGDFEFLLDVRSKLGARGLSDGQAKGVANCWRADVYRRKPKATPGKPSGLDLTGVPSGKYAVPGGDTGLKVKVDNIDKEGKWEGWVFVKDENPYGSQQRYGSQKPGGLYNGSIAAELAVIAADPVAASKEFGRITSTCGFCGADLRDNKKKGRDGLTSVERGIGPDCFENNFG